MPRIIIICEGETEQEFCNTILAPYFAPQAIYIQAPLIKKSMGGIVQWAEIKKQINAHLKNDPTAFVTTLIDYYGLYQRHEFPKWDEAHKEPNKNKRMEILEQAMAEDIEDALRYRYIPYIQLHEFEGLLFNDIQVFHEQILPEELVGIDELNKTFQQYDNPEMINNGRTTAPSKRLSRIILGYNKIVYGNILAEAIGLPRIREKSPRFNNWIHNIQQIKTQVL